jgi:hypothetical protein
MSTKHEICVVRLSRWRTASFVWNLVGALGNDGPCIVLPSSTKVYAPVGDSDR